MKKNEIISMQDELMANELKGKNSNVKTIVSIIVGLAIIVFGIFIFVRS